MGQHGQMDHLRVGHDDVGRVGADLLAEVGRGVAVVDGGRGTTVVVHGQQPGQLVEGLELVLGQGLEGKEIERLGLGIGQTALHDRQVVGQGLAAGRGRGRHDVAAGSDMVGRLGLMGVK